MAFVSPLRRVSNRRNVRTDCSIDKSPPVLTALAFPAFRDPSWGSFDDVLVRFPSLEAEGEAVVNEPPLWRLLERRAREGRGVDPLAVEDAATEKFAPSWKLSPSSTLSSDLDFSR